MYPACFMELESTENDRVFVSGSEFTIQCTLHRMSQPLFRRPLLPGDKNSDLKHKLTQNHTTAGAGQSNHDAHGEQKKSQQQGPREIAGGTAGGSTYFVDEEDPWARKRRMEMLIRRKDAKLRAQGVPTNGTGLARSSSSSTAISRVG